MQYPFPYKNSSGDTTSGGSTNLDPTFITTTTDTLLVTGNATFQGVIDAEIIVGTFVSGSNFTGQESKAGLSTTSQKNGSTNNTAYAGLEAINNNNGTVGLYSYGSSHATRPTSAWLETTNPLKVKGSTTSLFAGTNENLICSGTNVQLPFLTASRPVSTDGSFNLVSASITGTGSTVLQTSPTLITPALGAATGTSLQLSGLTASQSVQTDASKNLVSVTNTGTGNNVMSASPTLTGTTSIGTLNLSGLLTVTYRLFDNQNIFASPIDVTLSLGAFIITLTYAGFFDKNVSAVFVLIIGTNGITATLLSGASFTITPVSGVMVRFTSTQAATS